MNHSPIPSPAAPRIALIGPVWPYRGGIAHHTALAAEGLRQRGVETRLISFRRQYPAWLYPGASDKDNSQEPLKSQAEYCLDPLWPPTWLQSANTVLQHTPALAVIQWWTTFWSLPFAVLSRRLRRQIPVAYIVHNVFPHEPRPWDRSLARLALSGGSHFIAHSQQEAERLQALLPGCRPLVCPLPVYRVGESAVEDKAGARQALGLPPDAPTLLFFGFVRPYKGLHILLQALGQLRQQGFCPMLLVAGEFWHDKRSYLELIEQLGLGAQVQLSDRYLPNEEAARYFSAADALVAPYIEGATQSAVASLALGHGIPLIASQQVAQGLDAASRAHILEVPSGDAPALAQAIRSFFERGSAPPLAMPPADANSSPALVDILIGLAGGTLAGGMPAPDNMATRNE